MTWRDILMIGVGAIAGPALCLAIGFAWAAAHHGTWTSLDDLCGHPKDGRPLGGGRVTEVPRDGFLPLHRCPICGSRWVRSYLRRIPGAPRLLARVWSKPPRYTDDEIEARWDAYAARVGGDS